MLTKSKASACILTLILSFVFSDLSLNLMNCKLKPCIINCLVTAYLRKFLAEFSICDLFAKLVA